MAIELLGIPTQMQVLVDFPYRPQEKPSVVIKPATYPPPLPQTAADGSVVVIRPGEHIGIIYKIKDPASPWEVQKQNLYEGGKGTFVDIKT